MRFFSALITFPRKGRIAWYAAGRVALNEEELGDLRVVDLAVGKLARERGVLKRALASRQLARLARGLASARGLDALVDDLPGVARVLFEKLGQPLVDDLLHEPAHPRVSELRLRLPLELRVAQLDGDDRGQPFAHVLALEVVLLLLQQALLARVPVQRAGERPFETGEVGAALMGVDVVGEREDRLHVGAVPLHGNLDLALLALALEVDDLLVHGLLRAVHEADEVLDAALGVELGPLLTLALVDEDDSQPPRQERRLLQALGQHGARPLKLIEDLGVGQEGDRRAGLVTRDAHGLQVADWHAARELLAPDLAVALDFAYQPFGQRVHHRDAHPVQAARDLVAAAAELAAGMELRQHDGYRWQALVGHHVDRDARAVVAHGDRVVRVEDDLDVVAAAGKSLVDRVVDHLVDEVMEAPLARGADVHPGAKPDRLKAFQDRDVLGAVRSLAHKKCLLMQGLFVPYSIPDAPVGPRRRTAASE